jgi:CHASE2 domain-containing sensor protein
MSRWHSTESPSLYSSNRRRSLLLVSIIVSVAVISISAVILTLTMGIVFAPAILGAIGFDMAMYRLWRRPQEPRAGLGP